MSAAASEDTMICAELWQSFCSLVRAYASVNADPSPQVEANGDVIRVTAGTASLQMRCNPETGAGNWRLSFGDEPGIRGELQFLAEGRIVIDGKALDLDHAAIDLIARVTKAALHRGTTSVVPTES